MKKLLSVLVLLALSGAAMGESKSNDFGRSDSKLEPLSASELRQRLELRGEIFVTDKTGRLLFQENETRNWSFGSSGNLVSHWSFRSDAVKEMALRHEWSLAENATLSVLVQQFDTMERYKAGGEAVKTGKLLKEQKIEIKDFAPLVWVVQETDSSKVVVRITPFLKDQVESLDVSGLPISLSGSVVYDNQGRIWAMVNSIEGNFVSLKTHLGLVAISFSPFKGAKELGVATGSSIVLNANGNLKLTILSGKPIMLSTVPAKVYGFIDLSKKSERLGSVYGYSSSRDDNFLKNL